PVGGTVNFSTVRRRRARQAKKNWEPPGRAPKAPQPWSLGRPGGSLECTTEGDSKPLKKFFVIDEKSERAASAGELRAAGAPPAGRGNGRAARSAAIAAGSHGPG